MLSWFSLPILLLRNVLINAYPYFDGCRTCGKAPLPPSQRNSPRPQPDFPIDVVYTWVDGNDPALLQKKAGFIPGTERQRTESHGECLYRDNQELLYSLRSLELYAPWIRRVYIVTDRQKPVWLNTRHPGIRLVDHTEIIPPEYLPTFNSRVIEAHLYRIPDLAEHYIYFNDDFFLCNHTRPGDFFTAPGLPHLFTDWRETRRTGYEKKNTPHACSYANVCAYMAKKGLAAPSVIAAHGPYPQTRTNACKTYEFFAEEIRKFCKNKFRAMDEMAFHCHAAALWGYVQKRVVPCDIPYFYVNAKRFDRKTYYAVMLRDQNNASLPLFFCLNDVGSNPLLNSWQKDMSFFLQKFFPDASGYEICR